MKCGSQSADIRMIHRRSHLLRVAFPLRCHALHFDSTQPFVLARENTVPSLDITGHSKYFAKHLGCRVASDNYIVPAGFGALLSTDNLLPFEVSFSRNRELGDLPARGSGVLGNFPLLGTYSHSTGEIRGPYLSGTTCRTS